MFSDVLDEYTCPEGTSVNIQNLMMLAFTQNQLDGNSQFNIMTQNQMHISMMAQQQKELLKRQAAAIQEGTDKVLAAQNEMIEHLRTKQKEATAKQKEDNSRVMLLMTMLGELETALKQEKIRCLMFEKDL
jgi:hypothetical protein